MVKFRTTTYPKESHDGMAGGSKAKDMISIGFKFLIKGVIVVENSQICRQCILHSRVPGVTINENGFCNECVDYDTAQIGRAHV